MACSICSSRVKPSRAATGRKKLPSPSAVKTSDEATDGTILMDLPCGLISNILSRLPLISLLRCRLVSKSLNHLTRNPQFIECYNQNQPCMILHPSVRVNLGLTDLFLHQEEQKQPVRIPLNPKLQGKSSYVRGSCNGFLLIYIERKKPRYVIYNPITNETITDIPRPPKAAPQHVSFGYDSKTQTYKLVLEFKYIITLGETRWRDLLVPCTDKEMAGAFEKSVFFKGRFYWTYHIQKFVISLDCCSEKYTTISHPPLHETMSSFFPQYNLVVCNHKLALAAYNRQKQLVQVWNLGEEDETWIPYFRCNISDLLSNHCCNQHKFRLMKNVGNDSLLFYHIDANIEYDEYDDSFEQIIPWWKQMIIYTPNSGGGSVVNFTIDSKSRTEFRLLSFVPNFASFYRSTISS